MYPEATAAHAAAENIVGALLGCREPGLVVSIDIGGSLFDLVAANTAEATDCRLIRSHSLLRHQAVLGGRGPQLKVTAILAQPVIFGSIDGWLREIDDTDPLESYGRRSERIATRTIDGWSAARPPLRLVHFGVPVLARDQIQGASRTIARDRPVLTLYTAQQEKAELHALLESFGYCVFNLAGDYAKPTEPHPSFDFGWIAVPLEWQDEASSAAEQAKVMQHPGISRWEIEASRSVLRRQRRSAAMFGLASGAIRPLPLERTVLGEDLVCINDCYPVETAGSHSWRWLGPRPRARIALPCPLPCPYSVQLNVIGCKLKNGLSDCRIIISGREVSIQRSQSLPGTISFAANAEPNNYTGYIEIDVVSTGTVHPAIDDLRTLRLCLESISVSPWQ